jgi:[ribosomal protein S18]-alanine N-acetyltransferase
MLPGYNIYLTTEPGQIQAAARMMTETDPWITLGISYEDCLKAFEGPCKEIYILTAEGQQMVGFVILQVCGSFKGYIQTLCVDPLYRGRGLGTELLRFCEKHILKFSPNIFICVSAFNQRALELYLDFGFKQVGELENFVKEGYTEFLLRKTVGAISGYIPQ